jgi:hypothetical protein
VTALAEGAILAAFLAFCRIGACLMIMPGLSSVRVPVQVRLFTAVAVTMALLTFLWDRIFPFVDGTRPAIMVPMIVSELLVGGLIGALTRRSRCSWVSTAWAAPRSRKPIRKVRSPLSSRCRRCSCCSYSTSIWK